MGFPVSLILRAGNAHTLAYDTVYALSGHMHGHMLLEYATVHPCFRENLMLILVSVRVLCMCAHDRKALE